MEEKFELIVTPKGELQLSQEDSAKLKTMFDMINACKEDEKTIKAYFKEVLTKAYLEQGVNSIDSKFIKITLTPATTTTKFDEKRFKEEQPELYKKYLVTSSREASVRVTLREDE